MPTQKKISQLDQLTEIAEDDWLAVVDVSDTTSAATGTTKKITVADFLAQLNALQREHED